MSPGQTIWRKEKDGSWKNVVDIWNPEPAGKKQAPGITNNISIE